MATTLIGRIIVSLISLPCLVMTISGRDANVQKLKFTTGQPLFLSMKMKPAGGHLIITNGSPSGEVEVGIPDDSGARLTQKGNRLTIVGQTRPSTYTFRVPAGEIDIEATINGKKKMVRGDFDLNLTWDIE